MRFVLVVVAITATLSVPTPTFLLFLLHPSGSVAGVRTCFLSKLRVLGADTSRAAIPNCYF